jgi:hypothetical protein
MLPEQGSGRAAARNLKPISTGDTVEFSVVDPFVSVEKAGPLTCRKSRLFIAAFAAGRDGFQTNSLPIARTKPNAYRPECYPS